MWEVHLSFQTLPVLLLTDHPHTRFLDILYKGSSTTGFSTTGSSTTGSAGDVKNGATFSLTRFLRSSATTPNSLFIALYTLSPFALPPLRWKQV